MYAPLLQIIEAIGLANAMKLVEAFGGVRIYLPLPENVTADNEVAKVIGVEATRKLAEAWGGRYARPTIPLARRHFRAVVKAEIRRERADKTIPELARKYQTTERNIYRYLGEAPPDPERAKQRGLF
jgi:Mor family transcriptional regulator